MIKRSFSNYYKRRKEVFESPPMQMDNLLNDHFLHGFTVSELKRSIRDKLLRPIRILRTNDFEYMHVEEDEGNLADVNFTTDLERNYVFLWAAFTSDDSTLLQKLQELGADVNFVYPGENLNALHLAALHGSIECTQWLLKEGCKIITTTSNRLTPLHCAVFSTSHEICRHLVASGCQPDIKALHMAVRASAIECIEYLLKLKVPVNGYDESGTSPLHVAADIGDLQLLKLLLNERRIDVHAKTISNGYTALHLAAENGHLDALNLLLDRGTKIDVRTLKRQTALHLACKEIFVDCVDVLLKRGADINAQDHEMRTPLHSAVSNTVSPMQFQVVHMLTERNADVHLADKFGYTALHTAALNELDECVEHLILCGANATAKTKGNMTALNIMKRKTPACLGKIEDRLDLCMEYTGEQLLKFSFRDININSTVGEINYLYTLQKQGGEQVLEHPVCKAFLHLKWQKVRPFFLLRIAISLFTVVLFSSLVAWAIKEPQCYRQLITPLIGMCGNHEDSDNTTQTDSDNDSNQTEAVCHQREDILNAVFEIYPIVPSIVVVFIIFMLIANIVRIVFTIPAYKSLKHFFMQFSNVMEIVVTVSVSSTLFNLCTKNLEDDEATKSYASLTLLCAWAYMMITVSQLPAVGTYVNMFKAVLKEFIKMKIAFLCLVMGFTFTFYTLKKDDFPNPIIAFTKVMAMMTGELDSSNLLEKEEDDKSTGVTIHMYTIAFVLAVFLVSITIVLMNLLVGIAVNDVEGLRKNANLSRLIQQTKLIYFLEKACFRGCLPKYVMNFLRKFLYMWPDSYSGIVLYVRPLSLSEKRLPREVMEEGIARLNRKKEKEKGKKLKAEQRIKRLEQQMQKIYELVSNLPDAHAIANEFRRIVDDLDANRRYSSATNRRSSNTHSNVDEETTEET